MSNIYFDILSQRKLSAPLRQLVTSLSQRSLEKEKLIEKAMQQSLENKKRRGIKERQLTKREQEIRSSYQEDPAKMAQELARHLNTIESEEILVCCILNGERQDLKMTRGIFRGSVQSDMAAFQTVIDYQAETIHLIEEAMRHHGWQCPEFFVKV
jgi:hypothetical protein